MKVAETKCKEIEITDSKGNILKSGILYENRDDETRILFCLKGKSTFSLYITKEEIKDIKDLLVELCNQI